MTRFAVCRRLARFFACLDGLRAAESETTAGRQDKRPGANWRYGVVVGVFARCPERYSAASTAYPLIFLHFRRAAHFRLGRPA